MLDMGGERAGMGSDVGRAGRGPAPGRWLRRTVAVGALVLASRTTVRAAALGLDDVAKKAQELAAAKFEDPRGKVPDWLQQLTYDQWRDIRFRPDSALWHDRVSAFEVQFFHLGLFYDRAVRMNVVDAKGVRPVEFSPSLFDYGKNKFASQVPQDLGFAGFRLHYPIKTPKYHDEVIVFLGATYFRGVGKKELFGLSARGLAIDTAESSGEEFPYFREFWLVTPAPAAKEMVVYALLDSPSMTGAYRFTIRPGEQTAVDVEVRLYARSEVKTVGLAPLTSMFFHGENTVHDVVDFRPEVHDSDGLLLQTGTGEWIWRPLDNPRALHVSSFQIEHPKGFGLIQRDRDFASYQDLEARSELRPSTWVEPVGAWGPGRVELVQLHTADETNDNTVAYWVPNELPTASRPLDLAYRLHWQGTEMQRPPGAWVLQTRAGRSFADLGDDEQQFVVDFTGPSLAALPSDAPVHAVVTAPANGDIVESNAYRVEATGNWRMIVRVKQLRPSEPTELRGFLQNGKDVLTETWSNIVPAR